MIHLTPTKLRDFLTCPQMYELKHLRRVVKFVDSPAASFGRSIHKVLEDLHRPTDMTSPEMDEQDIGELLARHWDERCYDRRESAAYFSSARDALDRYVSVTCGRVKEERTLGTEVFMARTFNADGLRVQLGCKADRIGVRGANTLVIEDYKTSSSGKVATRESLETDLPTFLYYLLARITYPEYESVMISFLNVLSLARSEITYDAHMIEANKARLRECFASIATRKFEPRACEACAWCDAQMHCPMYVSAEVDLASVL